MDNLEVNLEKKSEKKIGRPQKTGKKYSFSLEREDVARFDELMTKINEKDFGKKITVSDVVAYSLGLINDSHLEKIQECSMSIKDRIERECVKFNEKNNSQLSIEEFIAKKLKILQ